MKRLHEKVLILVASLILLASVWGYTKFTAFFVVEVSS